MSTAGLAHTAYKASSKATLTPRSAEYVVLDKLSQALRMANAEKTRNYPGYVKALHDNLKFWTIVGADAASESSPLPAQLRAQLFFLYEFTQDHTLKIIRGDKNRDVEPLLAVNQNIMDGLSSSTGKPDA